MAIQLQGIGKAQSIAAKDLEVGMRIIWNFGEITDITKIETKGKVSLVVHQAGSDGKVYKQTMRKTKQVCGYLPKNSVL